MVPADDETIPFSNVTFFEADGELDLDGITDLAALKETLSAVVEEQGANLFYMVKIEGTFDTLKVRSEYKQEKPYRELDVALASDQVEFDYADIRGTLVGLYCPAYMQGLNSVGWHFHFISEDLARGGHVLQVNIEKAKAAFDATDGFSMFVPGEEDFQKLELSRNMDEAINRAETATNE